MAIGDVRYTALLRDEGFSNLNLLKVRRLIGLGLAEMLGSAIFMALGCGNLASIAGISDATHLNNVISFSFGLTTSIIIFGPISGSLLNPALNVAAVVLGHMTLPKCIFFTIFQLIGSVLGVSTVKLVTPNLDEWFCVTMPNPDVGLASAFIVEFLSTGVLALGFCNVLDPRTKQHGSVIFMKFVIIITALGVPGVKYGGCSLNPARSFGPAFMSSFWTNHWLYWCAPCSGSFIAALIYRVFFHHAIYEDKREDQNPI